MNLDKTINAIAHNTQSIKYVLDTIWTKNNKTYYVWYDDMLV